MPGTNVGLAIRKDRKGISFLKGEGKERRAYGVCLEHGAGDRSYGIFISLKLGFCEKSVTSRNLRNLSLDVHIEIQM